MIPMPITSAAFCPAGGECRPECRCRPRCDRHGDTMKRRDLVGYTREVKWCGEWWDCQHPRCQNTTLIPSDELLAQEEQLQSKAA